MKFISLFIELQDDTSDNLELKQLDDAIRHLLERADKEGETHFDKAFKSCKKPRLLLPSKKQKKEYEICKQYAFAEGLQASISFLKKNYKEVCVTKTKEVGRGCKEWMSNLLLRLERHLLVRRKRVNELEKELQKEKKDD